MCCISKIINCKINKDINIINASMSSDKVNENLTDRKPKGYFVKTFFEVKNNP